MEIVYKKVSDLKPYKNNPRKNDGAVDAVAASIKEFGFKVPIVIDGNNEIVAGHTRLKAAKKLKLTEVPCIVADDLTPDQIKAFRLVDNKTAELAEWDFDALKAELDNIDMDMLDFGFEEISGGGLENEVVEDEAPEPPDNPIVQLGEVWQLGRHRLMCGDSTDAETVSRLMNGAHADMVFTDPPYNTGMKPKKNRSAKLSGFFDDTFTDEEWERFMAQLCARYFEIMKDDTVA